MYIYKKIGFIFAAAPLFLGVSEVRGPMFSKYKAVEAYEVRPGILALPRYSENGQVCEVSIERLHYRPGEVVSSTNLSSKEVRQIFDEIVPLDQRGPRPANVLEQGGLSRQGNAIAEDEQYENVSLHIYGEVWAYPNQGRTTKKQSFEPTPTFTDGYVAIITWKQRKCR